MDYEAIFRHRGAGYDHAMRVCGHARDEEFAQLVRRARIGTDDVVCDVPACGGYLRRYLPERRLTYGLEVAAPFFRSMDTASGYRPVWCERLTQIPLKRGSIDCVLSLAGLHHIDDKVPVFAEFHRLLKPGGQLVVADVRDGSPVAQWLDSEVDRWSETGHRGDFFSGATRSALSARGFEVQAWTPVQIGWRFASAAEMGALCKSLFGLTRASEGDVIESLRS